MFSDTHTHTHTLLCCKD